MAGNPALWADVERDLGEAEKSCAGAVMRAESLERGAIMDPEVRLDRELAVGTMLHAVYCNLERALERLVRRYDEDLPQGRDYHAELVERAAHDVAGVRPAMISRATALDLHALRSFRHVVRNNYGGTFAYERAVPNVNASVRAVASLRAELTSFARDTGLIGTET